MGTVDGWNGYASCQDTPADGAIKKLFLGKMKSYIKCINVNYESSRSEDYYGELSSFHCIRDLLELIKEAISHRHSVER